MEHQWAVLKDLARNTVEGFARRQTMYFGAFVIAAVYLDLGQSFLGYVFCWLADLLVLAISMRIRAAPQTGSVAPRIYHRAMVAATVFSSLAVAHFALRLSVLEGTGSHTISAFFLIAAALYASMHIVQIARILYIRLAIYGATLLAIPLVDIWAVQPPLNSMLWAQFLTMVFVVYFLFSSAQFFRQRYFRDLAHLEEVQRHEALAISANKTKSRFLANMSHDLRTPMNGVLGMLEVVLRSDLSDDQRGKLDTAHQSARNLLCLLNDILDISKLEAGELTIVETAFEPRRVADEIISLLDKPARDKGLALHLDVDDAVPSHVMGDPIRIEQVLLNLVGNAVKFTDSGSVRLRVSATPLEDQVRLVFTVSDTGAGIPADVLPRLFNRFAQGDTSATRRFAGAGLGLAISRELAELMGGTIGVQTQEGRGSEFTLYLPTRCAVAPMHPTWTPSRPAAPPSRRSGGPSIDRPLTVLIAEDHPINQKVMEAFFSGTDHTVTLVENGAEVVAALDNGSFDVVLMDMQMPVMGGLETTKAIRSRPGDDRAIPIIALTANAMAGDRETYLAAGMDDYVSKPVERDALFAALARIALHHRPSTLAKPQPAALPS